MSAAAPPLVAMSGMSISFGGIRAVDDVSLDLRGGEVVGLLGHNGAGKSTFIKMLSGAYRPDAGEIRVDGRLVAMAGQRLRVPGHIEISGICTHPDHLGRGYGAALTRRQVHVILASGEQPFLHVRGDNTRAIALYERLGFAPRLRSRYVVMLRVA